MSRHRRRRAYRLRRAAQLRSGIDDILRSFQEIDRLVEQRIAVLRGLGLLPHHHGHVLQRELAALELRMRCMAPAIELERACSSADALRVQAAPLEQAAEALRRRP